MRDSHIYIEYKINTKSQLSSYLKSEDLKKDCCGNDTIYTLALTYCFQTAVLRSVKNGLVSCSFTSCNWMFLICVTCHFVTFLDTPPLVISLIKEKKLKEKNLILSLI